MNPSCDRKKGATRERSRREMLGTLSAGALLALGLWPGCASPEPAGRSVNREFQFIAVNDTHYMSEECGPWLQRAVGQMNRHRDAEFCLVIGDLVEKGERAHLGAVADIFSTLRFPVYPQIGNHDYLTDNDRSAYEAVFPKKLNYSFRTNGVHVIGFDSTQGTKYENTMIQPAALDWLKHTAARVKGDAPIILFTHFPLGAGVKYRPLNADAALDLFRDHRLMGVFNGHFHGATERLWNKAPIITNKCCALKRNNHDGTKEKGYFLCTVQNDHVSRQFIEVTGA